MTEYCDICDKDITGIAETFISKNGIFLNLCSKCRNELEEEEGVSGELKEEKCPECGQRTGIYWHEYEEEETDHIDNSQTKLEVAQ